MSISRRHFLAAAGLSATALVSGCASGGPGSSGDDGQLKFITPFGLDLSFAPLLLAASDGTFSDASLDVEFVDGKGSSQAITQVVAGSADIGQAGGLDVIRAIVTTEAPIVGIGTIDQASPFSWISPSDAPLKKPSDFRGKTVGVISVGGTTEAYLDVMLGLAGIDPEDVPRQAVGEAAGTVELMNRGDIAGFIASADTVALLKNQGEDVTTVPVDDFVSLPGQVYFASKRALEENPDTFQSFLQSAYDAATSIIDDPDGVSTAKKLTKQWGSRIPELKDTAAAGEAIRARVPLWLDQGKDNLVRNVPDLWSQGLEALVDSSFLETDATADSMYTNDLSDKVKR